MGSDIFIGNPELLLAGATEEERRELMPDLVIGLGGQLVSKRLKNFIQSAGDLKVIQPGGDPSAWIRHTLSIKGTSSGKRENSYLRAWKKVAERQLAKAERALDAAPFSNLKAVATILRHVPSNTVVHLGNSATVRYAQLLQVRNDLVYLANRGTSGIDGSVSTAAGAALVSDQLHLLVVGDLSFVYDSNALWNRRFPDNLRIIVVNDGGGGIFRLLDGPGRMAFFEEFSVTHHPVSIELLSQAFGREFQRASGEEELSNALGGLFRRDSSVSILEVDTTGSENSRIFEDFIKKLK
jgi:2-succinyl-5-enolpyruvyl-6-hydroxy-3-cyclohexene-1-carboxylate synthase